MIKVHIKDNQDPLKSKLKFEGPVNLVLNQLYTLNMCMLCTMLDSIPEREDKYQFIDYLQDEVIQMKQKLEQYATYGGNDA